MFGSAYSVERLVAPRLISIHRLSLAALGRIRGLVVRSGMVKLKVSIAYKIIVVSDSVRKSPLPPRRIRRRALSTAFDPFLKRKVLVKEPVEVPYKPHVKPLVLCITWHSILIVEFVVVLAKAIPRVVRCNLVGVLVVVASRSEVCITLSTGSFLVSISILLGLTFIGTYMVLSTLWLEMASGARTSALVVVCLFSSIVAWLFRDPLSSETTGIVPSLRHSSICSILLFPTLVVPVSRQGAYLRCRRCLNVLSTCSMWAALLATRRVTFMFLVIGRWVNRLVLRLVKAYSGRWALLEKRQVTVLLYISVGVSSCISFRTDCIVCGACRENIAKCLLWWMNSRSILCIIRARPLLEFKSRRLRLYSISAEERRPTLPFLRVP